MKVMVDIITGFLGSGKTKLINSILKNTASPKDKTLVIQCEAGKTPIASNLINSKNLSLTTLPKGEKLTDEFIYKIANSHNIKRLIIEANGTSTVESILNLFYSPTLKDFAVNKIFHTTNVLTYTNFMSNMGGILREQISNSNYIILTNSKNLKDAELQSIRASLKGINPSSKILTEASFHNQLIGGTSTKDKEGSYISSTLSKGSNNVLFIICLLLLACLAFYLFKPRQLFVDMDIDKTLLWLQGFNTIFLGILVEAIPFILLGVFISSIIQVFISSETITRVFPKNKGLGFVVALFSGLLFPVCDCAIIPVGTSLIKKGVPIPQAVTFILAAPIVNPIVIFSTMYAFPNEPHIIMYRLLFGAIIALICGLIFKMFPEKKDVLLPNRFSADCGCNFCSDSYSNKGFFGKVQGVFLHASSEFFLVGKFIIIGAFFSTVMNTMFSKYIINNLGGNNLTLLLIMMALAFSLSLCSTSDAFIGKTFMNSFPLHSILGFLVFGPMMDIKNILLLLGNFRKGFVIKLALIAFSVSSVVLSFSTLLFNLAK